MPWEHGKGAANPGMLFGGGGLCGWDLGQEEHSKDESLGLVIIF